MAAARSMRQSSHRGGPRWLLFYFLVILLFATYVDWKMVHTLGAWFLNDWMINYSGGFVRRGAMGYVLSIVQTTAHVNIPIVIFILTITCYAIMLFSVHRLLRQEVPWWMIMLVCSPATCAFTLFNPNRLGAKEVLLLALFGLVAVFPRSQKLLLFVPLIYAFIILSHEGMFLFLPYLLALYMIGGKTLKSLIPTISLSSLSFVLAALNPGTSRVALTVCRSMGGADLSSPPCSNAVFFLTQSKEAAHNLVLSSFGYFHWWLIGPFLLVMALLPPGIALRILWKNHTSACRVFMLCSVTSWLLTIPLFYYASDWDRWIYIHAFSEMLVLLVISSKADVSSQTSRPTLLICLAALYCCSWQLAFYHHWPVPERLVVYLTHGRKLRSPSAGG